ncbi:MAG: hypothetical protein CEN88_313 [Candidatus Berkelbacteria bacterium Licking1014_2]|uniref:Uncharacterized protein n=1 Tax=Candidatus Berkelbacteria bacterium Licking1014_2 TaxID=2017146 RepID=A0A554LUM6_9BACT|nr:MAG: hypothetical protein CEN88_313 [Candidatus Berkelbacteria bacterium Licking1014_2]
MRRRKLTDKEFERDERELGELFRQGIEREVKGLDVLPAALARWRTAILVDVLNKVLTGLLIGFKEEKLNLPGEENVGIFITVNPVRGGHTQSRGDYYSVDIKITVPQLEIDFDKMPPVKCVLTSGWWPWRIQIQQPLIFNRDSGCLEVSFPSLLQRAYKIRFNI